VSGREARNRRIVTLGHVAGAHGVQGWVKVHSDTEPREAIFNYRPWMLGESRKRVRLIQGKKSGNRLIALLENIESREAAEALLDQPIAVYRDQFPDPRDGQFYWTDLLGLKVRLRDGTELGTIDRILATGANDVMVVRGERERLIPFLIGQYVKDVDLDSGVVTVDWDPEF